jgi:exopolysaccharide biosynthesis polyprenyl glycosylphosphotransferase
MIPSAATPTTTPEFPPPLSPAAERTRSARAIRTTAASRGARLYLRLCRILDAVAGPMLLLAVFVLANFPATREGLEEFLGLRVTVKNLMYVIGFAVVWRLTCTAWGLYDWNRVRLPGKELLRVAGACSSASAVTMIFPAISVTGAFGVDTVAGFWMGSMVVLGALRRILRSFVLWRDRKPREVLIVGTGPRALALFKQLHARDSRESRVIGFVDTEIWAPERLPDGLFLGALSGFEPLLMRSAVDEVMIALPIRSRYEDVQQALRVCERVGVRAKYLADVFEHSQARARFEGEDGVAGVAMLMAPDDHRLLVKRALDISGAVLGLILLSPVLLAAALAVKLSSPGPVLFVQPRYGLNRRRFNMLKFRTMVDAADKLQPELEHLNESKGPAFKIRDDPRITPVGRWLRRTSIDELPQLWNVLRGEMSLVGPRPLPERDVHRFAEGTLMRRFSVWPGLTCLWQISGRSELSFERWIELDLSYVDRWSLALDLQILLKTVPAVIRGTGAT